MNVKDCKRLGKTTAGQSRPLQIKLPSADDVSAVSKSYRRQNNVSLNRDLTLRQRNQCYTIRKEYRNRLAREKKLLFSNCITEICPQ